MKSFCFFFAVPAVVSAAAAKCNADNCARALTGTFEGPARSSSRVTTDCSSFQLVTEYPLATTITTTSGSTSTIIYPSVAEAIVSPSDLPSYAQAACTPSGSVAVARFASACSCAGVTQTTTTAATPVVTVVVPTKNAQCNADLCARALTGTADGLAQPSSRINTDCSSFQLITAYPAATTITIQGTEASSTLVPAFADGLVIVPMSLPAYASAACSRGVASARFSSACSCAGVTETTTTLATQTATLILAATS